MKISPRQAAELLGVSPPTIRRWSNCFANSLSADASPERGRHRHYTEEDIEVMAKAKELLASGLTYERVAQLLAVEAKGPSESKSLLPTVLPAEPPLSLVRKAMGFDEATSRALQIISERDGQLAGALQTIVDQRVEIEKLRKRIDDLERRIQHADGGRELERLKNRLDILEKWQGRSWLARLFGWW